jgi:hypothetical protein
MDFVSLIHDEHHVPDPFLSKSVIESLRQAVFVQQKTHLTDEQVAIFLILLGGTLLVWEAA